MCSMNVFTFIGREQGVTFFFNSTENFWPVFCSSAVTDDIYVLFDRN